MKRVILFFALVFGVAMAAEAQSCGSKASTAGASAASCCSKGKASTASADATPSIGADIEQRTNAAGEVSYVRKVVNAETGAVSYTAVEYCTKTNQFIDAGTAAKEAKAHCADGEKAAAGCCSKDKTDAAPAKGKGAKSKA